jgi:hypothetical protein
MYTDVDCKSGRQQLSHVFVFEAGVRSPNRARSHRVKTCAAQQSSVASVWSKSREAAWYTNLCLIEGRWEAVATCLLPPQCYSIDPTALLYLLHLLCQVELVERVTQEFTCPAVLAWSGSTALDPLELFARDRLGIGIYESRALG